MSQSAPRLNRSPVAGLVLLAVLAFVGWEMFNWSFNRIYVPVGQSLRLRYKGPYLFGSRTYPPEGRLARMENMEIGVMEEMLGPGRHF